jgi:hypothetical protein
MSIEQLRKVQADAIEALAKYNSTGASPDEAAKQYARLQEAVRIASEDVAAEERKVGLAWADEFDHNIRPGRLGAMDAHVVEFCRALDMAMRSFQAWRGEQAALETDLAERDRVEREYVPLSTGASAYPHTLAPSWPWVKRDRMPGHGEAVKVWLSRYADLAYGSGTSPKTITAGEFTTRQG